MNFKPIKRFLLSPIVLRLLTVGLSFVSNIIINRSLGLELKGQYTTIYNYANLCQLALSLGICYSYPVIKQKYGEEKAKTALVSLIWAQTLIYSLTGIVILSFNHTIMILVTVLLSIALTCNSQIIFLALIDDICIRNYGLVATSFLYVVLNSFVYWIKPGNLFLIFTLLIAKYIIEILYFSKQFKYYLFSFRAFNITLLLEILKTSIPTTILAILISCNYNLDILMLNWMGSGNTQVAIYGVAYTLSNMLWILPDAFKELIYHKSADKHSSVLVLSCILVNMLICLTICCGFLMLGKFFLKLVYGFDYIVAFPVVVTVFWGILPMIAFKLIHPIYVNNGNAKTVVKILLTSVFCNIVASYLLIPAWGAFGAAIATVISYSICGCLFLKKYIKDYGVTKKEFIDSIKLIKAKFIFK